MKKNELKVLLKPLIKECINEVLLEEINHLILEESKTKRMIYSKKEIISNIQKI